MDISKLKEEIDLRDQSATQGLHGYACVSRHDFIEARMEKLVREHMKDEVVDWVKIDNILKRWAENIHSH